MRIAYASILTRLSWGGLTAPGRDLSSVRPDACHLNDQVTFVHVVQVRQEPSPLLAVKAFGEFQADIAGRVDQPPFQEELTEVGSYRFFAS